jgi:outer membrane biogenesis lipoprotein LolB
MISRTLLSGTVTALLTACTIGRHKMASSQS